MRFLILIKSDADSEAGVDRSDRQLAELGRYNEALARAGVLLAADGLRPSSAGARVRFSGSHTTVVPGPFGRPDELARGYWLIEVGSLDEAIEWVRRCPNEPGAEAEIEIRRVTEVAAHELREQEDYLRAQAMSSARPGGLPS